MITWPLTKMSGITIRPCEPAAAFSGIKGGMKRKDRVRWSGIDDPVAPIIGWALASVGKQIRNVLLTI